MQLALDPFSKLGNEATAQRLCRRQQATTAVAEASVIKTALKVLDLISQIRDFKCASGSNLVLKQRQIH